MGGPLVNMFFGNISEEFPFWRVTLISLLLLVNSFSMFVIFPVLPFMVESFFPQLPSAELGYYAGYLGGAFNLGSIFASIFWGIMSDEIGRRPVLLLGTLGTLICFLLFGFCKSFWFAVVLRLVWGMVNGNVGVAKTYVSEICSNMDQARGVAMIGLSSSVGRLLGPMVGGFLAQPAKNYPSVFGGNSFLQEYEFVLPMLVGSGFTLLICIFGYFHLVETDAFNSNLRDRGNLGHVRVTFWQKMQRCMRDPLTRKSILIYSLIGFSATMSEEIFSLWLVLEPESGGFGYTSERIGSVISLCAPVQLLFQAVFFPKLVERYGFKGVQSWSLYGMALFTFIIPFSNYFPRNFPDSPWMNFIMLTIFYSLFIIPRFLALTSIFGIVNNSATNQMRATANGVGQSFVSFTRFLAPVVGGIIFAWSSSTNSSFLVNFHTTFNLITVVVLLTSILSNSLPESINDMRRELMHDEESEISFKGAEISTMTINNEGEIDRQPIVRRRSSAGSEL